MLNQLDQFDKNIFIYLNSFTGKNQILDMFIKITTVYLVYLVPIILVFCWFYYKDKKIKKLLIGATFSGFVAWMVVSKTIAYLVARPRPIEALAGAKEILFHVPTTSFPSDHTTLLACLATYILLSGYKKIGTWAWIFTLIVGVSRIVGGMHYLGDIIAGAIVGIVVAWFFIKINKTYEKYIINPIYKIAQFLHLA